MRRPSRRAALRVGLPTAVALAAGAAIAYAAIPAADGTISACFNPTSTPPGQLRIIDAPTEQCLAGETPITWNQQGPPGPAGPAGPQGDPGFSGGGTTTGNTSTTPDTFPTPSQAGGPSADIFLKLDGIAGDSTDDRHKGEIDVSTVAFAVGRAATATSAGTGAGTGTSGSGTNGGGSGTGTGTNSSGSGTGRTAQTGTGTGTGAAATRGRLLTLRVDKNYDAASPLLLRAATTGQHIKSATLSFRRSGDPEDREFLTYTLTDVQVTGYDQGGTDGDNRDLGALEEQVDLTAAKIKATERTTTPNGDPGPTITGTWQRRGG